jgi:hypothetical protein
MSQGTPTMIQASQGQMMSPSRHSDVMISGMQMNGVHGEYPPVSMVGNNVQSQVGIKDFKYLLETNISCIHIILIIVLVILSFSSINAIAFVLI